MSNKYYLFAITVANGVTLFGNASIMLANFFRKMKAPSDKVNERLDKLEEYVKSLKEVDVTKSINDLKSEVSDLREFSEADSLRLDRIEDGLEILIRKALKESSDEKLNDEIVLFLTSKHGNKD